MSEAFEAGRDGVRRIGETDGDGRGGGEKRAGQGGVDPGLTSMTPAPASPTSSFAPESTPASHPATTGAPFTDAVAFGTTNDSATNGQEFFDQTGPAQFTHPDPAHPRPDRRRFGWAGMLGTAALAAVLASGGTFGVLQLADATSSEATQVSTSSPTVVQASSSTPDWTTVADAVGESVVSIVVPQQGGEAVGSGVVWNGDGMVVTNNHVVESATQQGGIRVMLGGQVYEAAVVGSDATTDLAVLQIVDPPADLQPITLGDSDTVEVGADVMAIGNPLGLSDTVTTGIVSALDRPVTTASSTTGEGSEMVVTNAIQTSAPLNPGNSGGALVDASGRLIGINSAIASVSQGQSQSASGNIGIGFAIPVNEVANVVEQLIDTGTVDHAYLGASVGDGEAALDGGKAVGAELAEIIADSPADRAGLQDGDVVTAIDGTQVTVAESLIANIRAASPGDTVTLAVVRDGTSSDMEVALGANQASNG
ncbi:MAG: trypsin-like peptidase domain-containing protein [Pseudoclavibacter sp.]